VSPAPPPVPTPIDRDPVVIDTSVAHTSRVYDFLLGGTTHFAVDREVAADAFSAYPDGLDGARTDARANRAFLGRAVRYLVDAGVRQFLDIGSGIPATANTHEVAQHAAPESRVVYVDNDPIVLAHAHALLNGTPQGATAYLHGDLRQPAAILEGAARTLDLTRPVALLLVGVLHVVPDADRPRVHVAHLVDALVPGSHLVISHMTDTVETEADLRAMSARLDELMRRSNPPALRPRDEVARFFDGLELLDPGLVPVPEWRPDDTTAATTRPTPLVCGVGRKR
jgi:SAM-dependent methyltransferase